MPSRRDMRMVKVVGGVPEIAACTNCGREFKVYSSKTLAVDEATERLGKLFATHDCKEDASQAAARIVKEEPYPAVRYVNS
jgi:hypothetical protein